MIRWRRRHWTNFPVRRAALLFVRLGLEPVLELLAPVFVCCSLRQRLLEWRETPVLVLIAGPLRPNHG
jgi:hypothetical protein